MEPNNKDYERYQAAKKKVAAIKGFYAHLASYIFVMVFLIYINLKYSPEYLWFFWSLFGWGVGLFFHGMRVFNYYPFLNKDWEERKIKEFMEEESKKNKFQ